MLKQFAVTITAALVLGSIGTGAALADLGAHRVDRLHQHQGVGPRGPHHHYGPRDDKGDDHGHGRSAA